MIFLKILDLLISYLTPVQKVGEGFVDVVSGKKVSYYKGRSGTIYMKDSKYSLFKVRIKESGE